MLSRSYWRHLIRLRWDIGVWTFNSFTEFTEKEAFHIQVYNQGQEPTNEIHISRNTFGNEINRSRLKKSATVCYENEIKENIALKRAQNVL
ncbi:hypothetical protein TNCV_4441241 [Trichonephila clavipes]|nr:hypothetical protein TNCV_4441241 [Trichonephila clavipes]